MGDGRGLTEGESIAIEEYVPDDQNLKEYFHLLERVTDHDDLDLLNEFVQNNSSKLAKTGSDLEFLVTLEMFKKEQRLEILHTRSHKFKPKNSSSLQSSIIDFVENYPRRRQAGAQRHLEELPTEPAEEALPRYKLNTRTKETIRRELLRMIPIVSKTDVIPLLEKLLKVALTRSGYPLSRPDSACRKIRGSKETNAPYAPRSGS